MENLPHSVSKKSYNGNGNGVRPKTMYDDVFGGPPKLGGVPTLCPRVSDYTEIFSNFHASPASSIPILDLPPVNDADFSFDVRSSIFDYSQVFGGLNGVDFAASFEQLFELSKTTCDSSDEAWTHRPLEAWYILGTHGLIAKNKGLFRCRGGHVAWCCRGGGGMGGGW
ncbi:hypothetical protein CsSME_00005868 [Camellia sinensis var. sinensis]